MRRRLLSLLVLPTLVGAAWAQPAAASVSAQRTIRPGGVIPADFFPDKRGIFRKGNVLPLRYLIVHRRADVTRETHTTLKCRSGYRMVSLATDRLQLAFIVDRADRKYRGRLRAVGMQLYPAYPDQPGRGGIYGLCFKKP